MNEMWLDGWMDTNNNVYSEQYPVHVHDQNHLYPIIETTQLYDQSYKTKQSSPHIIITSQIRNVYTNNSTSVIESKTYKREADQLTPKFITENDSYLLNSLPNLSERYHEQLFSNHYNTTTRLSSKTSHEKSSHSIITCSPCLVCGDESSGFHYGVISCEGCKGFFRRCITQGMSHHCNNMGNCEITSFSRNSCQYCRLKKCFTVGMSRQASRLGRRPKRPRSNTVTVFENVKEQINHSSSFSKLFNEEILNRQEMKFMHEDPQIFKTQLSSDIQNKQVSSINTMDLVVSPTLNMNYSDCILQQNQLKFIPEIHQEIQRKLSSMLIYQEKLLTDIEIKEIDHIANALISIHCQYGVYTAEKIKIKIEKNLPVWADTLIGEFNSDPTSLWINWQLNFPLEIIFKIFKIHRLFEQISYDDQICLFRYGAFDIVLVSWFMLFDTKRKLMLTPDFLAYMNRDCVEKINELGIFILEIFDLGMKANHFQWTDSNIALFNALVFMNPERPNLCNKEHIGKIESKLMQVLYRHLRINHSNEPNIFFNMLQLIPLIQEVNQRHLNIIKHIKQSNIEFFNSLPDVYRKIYEHVLP